MKIKMEHSELKSAGFTEKALEVYSDSDFGVKHDDRTNEYEVAIRSDVYLTTQDFRDVIDFFETMSE